MVFVDLGVDEDIILFKTVGVGIVVLLLVQS